MIYNQNMNKLSLYVADLALQSLNVAYAVLDEQGVVTTHSDNFIAQLGLVGTSASGQCALTWDMLVGAEPDLRAVLVGALPQLILRQVQVYDARYVDVHVMALEPGNPQAGWLMLVHDVSELARMQQALTQDRNDLRLTQARLQAANTELDRLNRFKRFMLLMVAHDLRAPLAAMRGYAEIALTRLPNRHHHYIERIIGLIDHNNLLIQNLIDLEQFERGELVIQPSQINLNDIVADVLAAHQPLAALRLQTLRLHSPAQLVYAWADAGRVQQILYNLLNNALKYTPSGGEIELSLTQVSSQVIIQVSDTGPGLTATQRANLFQLHYRTEPTRQAKVPGSGLGLFIVKILAEAQHGKVQVDSTPGVGSVFSIVLPATKEDYETADFDY